MALFSKKQQHIHLLSYLPLLLLLALLAAFAVFSDTVSESTRAQEKQALAAALTRSITQCYALEGTYPSGLSYLKEHYGLTYNETHFFVDYQYIGGNLRPDITIIEKQN